VKFRPLQDRVLIRRIEEEETDGRRHNHSPIPAQGRSRWKAKLSQSGAGHPGRLMASYNRSMSKVGDRVLFGKWVGNRDQIIDGEDFDRS